RRLDGELIPIAFRERLREDDRRPGALEPHGGAHLECEGRRLRGDHLALEHEPCSVADADRVADAEPAHRDRVTRLAPGDRDAVADARVREVLVEVPVGHPAPRNRGTGRAASRRGPAGTGRTAAAGTCATWRTAG